MNIEQATPVLEGLKVAWSSTKAEDYHRRRTQLVEIYKNAAGYAVNHVLKQCGIHPDDTILEIGSGNGAFEMMLKASPNYRETRLIQTDITDISVRQPGYEQLDLSDIVGTNKPLPQDAKKIVGLNVFHLLPPKVQGAVATALAKREVDTVLAMSDLRHPVEVPLDYLTSSIEDGYFLFPSFESFFGQVRPEGWLVLPPDYWSSVLCELNSKGFDIDSDANPKAVLGKLLKIRDVAICRYLVQLSSELKHSLPEGFFISSSEFYIDNFVLAYRQAGFNEIEVFSVRQSDPHDSENPIFFYFGDFVDTSTSKVLPVLPSSSGVAFTVCLARRDNNHSENRQK